jgi:hypothetical protein
MKSWVQYCKECFTKSCLCLLLACIQIQIIEQFIFCIIGQIIHNYWIHIPPKPFAAFLLASHQILSMCKCQVCNPPLHNFCILVVKMNNPMLDYILGLCNGGSAYPSVPADRSKLCHQIYYDLLKKQMQSASKMPPIYGLSSYEHNPLVSKIEMQLWNFTPSSSLATALHSIVVHQINPSEPSPPASAPTVDISSDLDSDEVVDLANDDGVGGSFQNLGNTILQLSHCFNKEHPSTVALKSSLSTTNFQDIVFHLDGQPQYKKSYYRMLDIPVPGECLIYQGWYWMIQ